MTTTRARIVRAADATGTESKPVLSLGPTTAQWRRIASEELAARLAAERLVQEAQVRAEEICARAREQASAVAEQAVREAEERAEATVAARLLVLRRREDELPESELERVVAVATVLAERLLGVALELRPALVMDLARAAIAEARGARHIAIEAHPLDVETLSGHLEGAGFGAKSVEVRPNETLARGELRLQTDIGTIDVKLAPRLDRLAAALRNARP
jgi:flagellar biosynthesis/type III secretory pathway protein FliH